MTTVLISCPACQHESQITLAAVHMVICEHGARYGYQCPVCGVRVSLPAPAPVVQLLVSAGLQPLVVRDEPGGRGPALTEDDLIEFGRQLEALT